MKHSTKLILIYSSISAAFLAGMGVLIYFICKEDKQKLARLDTNTKSSSATMNTTIEHDPAYDQSKRGYRNNNPLNLRISSNAWKGKVPREQNTDGAFEQFSTMPYGFRAAIKNIQTYIRRDNLTTIPQIINKWAPPSDGNNTTTYINHVAEWSGISQSTTISADSKDQMTKIIYAMAKCENGSFPQMTDIYKGWDLI